MGFKRSPPTLISGAGYPRHKIFKNYCSTGSLGDRYLKASYTAPWKRKVRGVATEAKRNI